MRRVQGRAATAGIVAAAFAAVVATAPATGASHNGNGGAKGKTTICHHTSSETNPWVRITVSDSSLKAHRKHGDVIPAPASGCPSGDDGGGDGGGGGGGDIPT